MSSNLEGVAGAEERSGQRVHEDALWSFVTDVSVDDLDSATIVNVTALVLDHLTCAIVGMDLPWTRLVRDAFEQLDALPSGAPSYLGPAFRYGSTCPLSTRTAALINGTAAHGLDMDDLYFPAMTHPGAVIISAAFAVAAATGAGGRDFLTAITAGYECMARVGDAVGVVNVDHGFHATGQQGPLGATVAVGRLLGFDRERIENAVGLAVSLGSGIKAFTEGPGMVKRLHAGRAAEAGIVAAHATLCGLRGPTNPLTSPFGFVHVFALGGPERTELLSAGLGERYAVDEIYFKPYAACGALHGALAAAESLVQHAPLRTDEIERVTVGTSRRAVMQNRNPDPRDVLSAQYSTEYCVALALLGGARDANRFLASETGGDDDVRQIASLIDVEVDARAEAAYPASNQARVDVVLRDGRRLSSFGVASSAESRGWSVAERKFVSSTRDFLAPPVQDAVVKAVQQLVEDGPVGDCSAPLADTK